MCQRGRKKIYLAWDLKNNSVSTHCFLLLFKSEDEQVLSGTRWFWSKCGQISRDRHSNTQSSLFINLTLYIFVIVVIYMCNTFLLLLLSSSSVRFISKPVKPCCPASCICPASTLQRLLQRFLF